MAVSSQRVANDWDLSFEDFDQFRDLAHLTRLVVQKVERKIEGARAFFFVHNLSLREFREEDKEGAFSITEDNPLITYLAIGDRIIDRKKLADDPAFKGDEANVFMIIEQLGITTLVPFVHRYQLLGFVGIRLPEGRAKLAGDERAWMGKLRRELVQPLFAAALIDRRFSELVVLSDLGKEISAIRDLPELYACLFGKLEKVVRFSQGALYVLEDAVEGEPRPLAVRASKGLHDKDLALRLPPGESISGYVYLAGKPLLIKELERHGFFNERNLEPWLTRSLISIPMRAHERPIGVLTLHAGHTGQEFTGENLHLVSIFANFTAATIANIRLYKKMEKGYFDTITALVAALDAKDSYSAGHSERVMTYAVGVAEELDLPADKVRLIRFAAILHDIGKIGIRGDIIRKPGQLTEEEFSVIRRHPEIGEQIISAIEFLRDARVFIKYHHERFDGEGYYHKAQREIPREALILNIADTFDAMTTDRPYRKGFTYAEAIEKMQRDIGKQFEPESFHALVRFLKKKDMLPADFNIV